MTSLFSIGIKQFNCAGRTVRDIVEHDPEQVSEVWCRKIFRQLLHVLERQYAMQLPHRVITPDTIVLHADGTPALLPSPLSDPMPRIADDLTALARTVHYAITRELVPTGPLRGRGLKGYSDSLTTAIDRSMAPDPARRPRTIGEMRELLGIVATGRIFAPAMPASPPWTTAPSRPMRIRYLTLAGGSILLVAGLAMFVYLRGGSASDPVVRPLPLPERNDVENTRPQAAIPAVPAPVFPDLVPPSSQPVAPSGKPQASEGDADTAAEHMQAEASGANAEKATKAAKAAKVEKATKSEESGRQAGTSASDARVGKLQASDSRSMKPATPPRSVATQAADPPPSQHTVPGAPASSASATNARTNANANANASTNASTNANVIFDLQIQPWGVVYVDGVKRGISPPIKQLTLAPGRHAILVSNPGSGSRVLDVDTATGNGRIAVNFDSAPQ